MSYCMYLYMYVCGFPLSRSSPNIFPVLSEQLYNYLHIHTIDVVCDRDLLA